jgi:hypothetical protein
VRADSEGSSCSERHEDFQDVLFRLTLQTVDNGSSLIAKPSCSLPFEQIHRQSVDLCDMGKLSAFAADDRGRLQRIMSDQPSRSHVSETYTSGLALVSEYLPSSVLHSTSGTSLTKVYSR